VCAVLAVVLLACFGHINAASSNNKDWPQFRGVNRDGISPETGLLKSWPESGPKEVWRVAIGEGYSAIAIVGDRLYTMYADRDGEEDVEFAAAFDTGTGKEVWRTRIGLKLETQFGNGPRATPLVDGNRLYVMGSRGDFAALKASDGAAVWAMSITEKFGAGQPYWGFSSSALVEDGQLLVETGGPEGKLFTGLDKMTGEVKWSSVDGATEPSHNSAIAIDLGGRRHYVSVSHDKLRGIDGQGAELWSYGLPEGEKHASPVFIAPDKIFASGAEGVGGTLVQVKSDGETFEVSELWKTRFMRNHFSSSVVHGDHLFGFDNATLKAIAVADAKMAWGKRGLGKGSLILADGHLLVLSDQGKLLLVEASPEKYVEKGSVQVLEGRCWTAPTLSDGKLYLRNHTEMVVYDLNG
jgi:outer membrane protein assembly factor BamB